MDPSARTITTTVPPLRPSYDRIASLAAQVPVVAAFALAAFLFTYTPYRLAWPTAADGHTTAGWHRVVAVGLAVVTFLGGVRWSVFFAMAYLAHRRTTGPQAPPPRRWP